MPIISKHERAIVSILIYIIFSITGLSFLLFEIWSFFDNHMPAIVMIFSIPALAGVVLGYNFGKTFIATRVAIIAKVLFISSVFICGVINTAYSYRFQGIIKHLMYSSNSSTQNHQYINIIMLDIFAISLIIGILLGYYTSRNASD